MSKFLKNFIKSVENFNIMLSKDDGGKLLKKNIRNVIAQRSEEEEDGAKQYDKYAQELKDYGAPTEIVNAFRLMALDEFQHHFILNRLLYGLK